MVVLPKVQIPVYSGHFTLLEKKKTTREHFLRKDWLVALWYWELIFLFELFGELML